MDWQGYLLPQNIWESTRSGLEGNGQTRNTELQHSLLPLS